MIYIKKSLSALFAFALTLTAMPLIIAQEYENDRQMEYRITLPEGTILPIVINAYLNTKSSRIGDTVYATSTYPIWIQQRLVIPKGSEIRGTLVDVVRPGRVKGKGRMVIRFDDILLPNGVKRDLPVTLRGLHGPGEETLNPDAESVDAGGSVGEDVGIIITSASQGAGTGALVGLAAGRGGTFTLIGAGVGAVAGIFTRGRDLVLAPGTQFELELLQPLEFSYNEIEFNH